MNITIIFMNIADEYEPQTTIGIGPGMPVNNNRNQGVDFTEVIKNYGKITCGAHNYGKIADSVINRSLCATPSFFPFAPSLQFNTIL